MEAELGEILTVMNKQNKNNSSHLATLNPLLAIDGGYNDNHCEFF